MTTANNDDFFPRPRMTVSPDGPICWTGLDEEHAAETLDELADWVQWLTRRYVLDHRTVPDCWDRHGPVIEELSALYTAWLSAYIPSADGNTPLVWMSQLAAARHRLTDWVTRTGCRPGEHQTGLAGQR